MELCGMLEQLRAAESGKMGGRGGKKARWREEKEKVGIEAEAGEV